LNNKSTQGDKFIDAAVQNCYQCGKCTAGCPVAEYMDVMPSQLMRLIQINALERAQQARAIWQCVSCQTCSTRCPQSVDIAGAIDILREMSIVAGNYASDLHRVVAFQKAFLDSVRRHGRLNEVELIRLFKTAAFLKDFNIPLLMKDAMMAPKLMQRGKFHAFGESVKDRGIVERIFERCYAKEEGK